MRKRPTRQVSVTRPDLRTPHAVMTPAERLSPRSNTLAGALVYTQARLAFSIASPNERRNRMARKTVLVSDVSGQEIADGKGATVRITYRDARKGVRELDVTDEEAEKFGG